MTRIQKERDRLLGATARGVGITATVVALLCFSVPGALPWPVYVGTLPVFIVLGFAQYRLALPGMPVWVAMIVVLGVCLILSPIALQMQLSRPILSGIGILAGGSVATVSIILARNRQSFALVPAAFVITAAAVFTTVLVTDSSFFDTIALTVAGWIVLSVTGVWLASVVPRTLRRIGNMGMAYQAERQASETEARRRQGARLLHDTVLATLTLLAHSGVGVGESALREQAGEDAALLRQLRLGFTPNPTASGDYKLKPVEESTLGNTLESVKQRFRRMGLEVSWHGTGHVLLPADTLDSFLLALAECLENVRRHSGVDQAHVTITDDDTTVRAMVTDAGVGFDVASIGEGRLGFTESIVARLRDAGGNARLFSSPGSGTTVVLEVPK